MQFKPLIILIFLSLLSACSANKTMEKEADKTTTITKPANKLKLQGGKTDLEWALNNRGFEYSRGLTISYLQAPQCNDFTLQSHRGFYDEPENSLASISKALEDKFDVVEIDVMVTADGVWVLHHDEKVGRATGSVDNEERRIAWLNYKKYWGYLRHRDMKTGLLTNTVPPTLYQAIQTFNHYATANQQLNIEIKGHADEQDLKRLELMTFKYMNEGTYFFSSMKQKTLEKLRGLNDSVYLGYVLAPHPKSLLEVEKQLEKAAKTDPLFDKNRSKLKMASGYSRSSAKKNDPARKSYDHYRKVKGKLGSNMGFHMDVRHLMTAPLLASFLDDLGTLATYSINGQDFHAKSLRDSKKSIKPEHVIIDDSVYGFCAEYDLPRFQRKNTHKLSGIGAKIDSLPLDLDLERLNDLRTYEPMGYYPAIGEQLKPIAAVTQQSKNKVQKRLSVGKKQQEEEVDLNTKKALKVEVRNDQ